VTATFTQYPIILGWAFTIHKSQGQTFDKVAIMAQDAWEHGQVYVAVSRCKTLEGIILETPVKKSEIRVKPAVERFLAAMRRQAGKLEDMGIYE
jgi:ATP-dependent exoDNAse (exonuclease V) alpha subunit